MKTIKKITNKVSDNFSALAGSALLVGATLTGGAALASAQSGSSGDSTGMDLGEYPQPFVTEDGEVQTSIVLGSDAQVTDVVGATEIAGSLGAAAFGEDQVSTGSGSFGWSASEGVTLDTRNDQLYFGDNLDTVRETLTEDDLEILSETTFTDDNNEETDVTNYLNLGNREVQFGNGADELDNEDPELYVDVPSESSVDSGDSSHLFNLQANFEDSLNFSDSDVAGEEIELFGTEYTIADENAESGHDTDELLLYGSQQDVDVDSGESTTITVNEEEVTLEVVSVNEGSTGSSSSGNAAVRVDGTLESVESGDTISVNNEEVRIDEIIKTGGSDSSSGVVNFRIGSQELTLVDGEPIQDSNDDDIEGSRVYFNGDGNTQGTIDSISSIDLYVGAEDDDEDALTSGDTFSHSALPGVEVHFGGLNPDASEEGDTVSQVEVSTNGDDTLSLDMTAEGDESASVDFLHGDGLDTNEPEAVSGDDDLYLADSDGDQFVSAEGEPVTEDQYFTSDAGDFAHLWEVTGVDRDQTDSSSNDFDGSEEATVDLRDAVTGDTIEVELDAEGSSTTAGVDYVGTEIIDGQTYYFALDGGVSDDSSADLEVAWGENADFDSGNGVDSDSTVITGAQNGGSVSAFTPVDTESGASVAFTEQQDVSFSDGSSVTVELPSTESTDAATVTLSDTAGADGISYSSGEGVSEVTVDSPANAVGVQVNGGATYVFTEDSGGTLTAGLANTASDGDVQSFADPSAVVIQPENDGDEEEAYALTNGWDSGDSELTVASPSTSDSVSYTTLESDDDIEAAYDTFGAYSEYDSDGQGNFMLNQPDGQAVAGAAVTGTDGDLSMGGGSGSVSAASPTYEYADGVLADDGNVGQVKNNDNIIVVGGPAANSLTQELVEENQTMPAGDYTSGQGMIQMVDGWSEGNSALVVAGQSGEDTRTAAEFLADYRNNQDALEGNSEVTIETSSGSVVN